MTAQRAAGCGPRSESRHPFSVADEENCYIDSRAEPNNVHLEAWLPGHLDVARLRAAVAGMLAAVPQARIGAVPQARIRKARGSRWRTSYDWECPPEADFDPVSVLTWHADAELTKARADFFAASPELSHCPPFRLLLAQGPEWDSLILNAHHAAFDGRSCVMLLTALAEHYSRAAGRAEPSAEHPAGPAPAAPVAPAPAPAPAPAAGKVGRPARIAAQHDGRPSAVSGYGLSLLEWPGVPARPPAAAGHPPATVNDLLIAALAEAVARWNASRGQPVRQVRISMPIDARGPAERDVFGNHSRLATISVDPRSPADPVAVVAGQTRRAKDCAGPAAGPLQAIVALPLPVPAKGLITRLALRTVGGVTCDTTLLSNLGNMSSPPAFGPLVPTSVWFSTSAHMPRGLSVGAITVGGRLHLCFRHCAELFDEAAGTAFAAEYARALAAISPLPGSPVVQPEVVQSPVVQSPVVQQAERAAR